jgi:Ca2+-binding RTX toxin-like protein
VGVAVAAVLAGGLAVGTAGVSTAADDPAMCHGKPATYVGTNGRDVVKDFKKNVNLGRHPVIVLGRGNDLVELAGDGAVLGSVTACMGPGADDVEIFEGAGANSYLFDGGPGRDQLGNGELYTDFSYIKSMTILGGGGDDYLRGANDADLIRGGSGDDRIKTGNGDDRAKGNDGDDRIFGQGNSDRMSGGRGSDLLIGDSRFYNPPGRDTADGGQGRDRCKAEVKRNCER